MSLYTISDLHLSLGADKPMDVFRGWENYEDRIKALYESFTCYSSFAGDYFK